MSDSLQPYGLQHVRLPCPSQTPRVEVRNRFKGLDQIDRLPEELLTEVCNIVKEAGIKEIPKEIPKKRSAKRQNGCLRRPYK